MADTKTEKPKISGYTMGYRQGYQIADNPGGIPDVEEVRALL